MKKILLILLLYACGNLMASDFDPSKFASGSGTFQSPYIITTNDHLRYLAEMVNTVPGSSNGVFFRLGANINIWESEQPIGISETHSFQGSFDGNRLFIRHFWQLRPIADNTVIGLFGYTSGALIRNLTIERGRIYNEMGSFTGVLIGNALKTEVENCHVIDVDISVSGNATGGFIGYAREVTVTNSSSRGGAVTGSNNVGGFIGKIEEELWAFNNTVIRDCYSSNEITGVKNVGGFIGVLEYLNFTATEISNCYATGSVVAYTDDAGGFIGACYNHRAIITNCYATGYVVGASRNGNSKNVGGFLGTNWAKTIERCYASGSVKGNESVGGFSGSSGFTGSTSSITNCYAVGSVEGVSGVGGFTGVHAGGEITKSFATGAVIVGESADGGNLIGAFVGHSRNSNEPLSTVFIKDCYFDKQTTGIDYAGLGLEELTGVQSSATSELTQLALFGFSSSDWLFNLGFYPQLRAFASTSASYETQLWSDLSAVPLKPTNDTEFCSDLLTVVSLTNKTPAGNSIMWFSELFEEVTILDNVTVFAKASNLWRTLTLRTVPTSGNSHNNIERNVKFRSTTGMTEAEIFSIMINHKQFDIDEEYFTYHIECGIPDISVFVEINLSPYSSCEPGSPIVLHANIPQDVIVRSLDGKTKTYTFVAEKHLPSDIFIQRWNDVLTINNNINTNGGYTFTNYEWYINNELMPNETKGYILLNEPASYTAIVTTKDENKLKTCPFLTNERYLSTVVYPNPVQRGQIIFFEIDNMENLDVAAGFTTSQLQLFNSAGNLIFKQNQHNTKTEINAPNIPGTYILEISTNGDVKTFKIVVE